MLHVNCIFNASHEVFNSHAINKQQNLQRIEQTSVIIMPTLRLICVQVVFYYISRDYEYKSTADLSLVDAAGSNSSSFSSVSQSDPLESGDAVCVVSEWGKGFDSVGCVSAIIWASLVFLLVVQ